MRKMSAFDYLIFILLVLGGLNSGFIGFFRYDIIAHTFGALTAATRTAYAIIGLAAVYGALKAIANYLGIGSKRAETSQHQMA